MEAAQNVKLLRADTQGIMSSVFRRVAEPSGGAAAAGGSDAPAGLLTLDGYAAMLDESGLDPDTTDAIVGSGIFEVRWLE